MRTKVICPPEFCTGCLACYNACPKNAIELQTERNGYIAPVVNNRCVNCNLCVNICPQREYNDLHLSSSVYAAYAKSYKSMPHITSGGVATLMYMEYLSQSDGVVYGVIFNNERQRFEYSRHNVVESVQYLSGSKYVQPDIDKIFTQCRSDLTHGNKVMFVGAPCVVAGLINFLQRPYSELFCVDIICHGIPSQQMFFDSIRGKIRGRLSSVYFRDGNRYRLILNGMNNESVSVPSRESDFFEGFHSGRIIREACHNCIYASPYRVSDITLGDYWGLGEDSRFYMKQKKEGGVSLVLVNSNKGKHFLERIHHQLEIEERSIAEAILGNSQLSHPLADTKYASKFRTMYCSESFEYSIKQSRSMYRKLTHNEVIRMLLKKLRR